MQIGNQYLPTKGLIISSKLRRASPAFYINKHLEQVRGNKTLVIDYKKLNDYLKDNKYHIPQRYKLLKLMLGTQVFLKFDMKSGF